MDRVKTAVRGGEDIDGRDSDGNTALYQACREGHVDIVQYLLANGANTELREDIITGLHFRLHVSILL